MPSPLDPPPGCVFHTRCPKAQEVCRVEAPPLEPAPGPPGDSRRVPLQGMSGFAAASSSPAAVRRPLVLLVMSFVIYSLIGLMPGDPIDMMIASNPGATPEVVAHLRAIYGLDQPILLRYAHWLAAALQGDFGYSRTHAQPVLTVLLPALWQTCKLMLHQFRHQRGAGVRARRLARR